MCVWCVYVLEAGVTVWMQKPEDNFVEQLSPSTLTWVLGVELRFSKAGAASDFP